MAKEKDAEAKARQKLAGAQAKLRSAEEKRRQIVARGEAQLERVRKEAAEAVHEANAKVEQRSAVVAKAEARLLALRKEQPKPAPDEAPSDADLGIAPASAEKAADRLEAVQSSADQPSEGPSVPVVETPDSTANLDA